MKGTSAVKIIAIILLFIFFMLLEGSLLSSFFATALIPDFILIFVVCLAFLWDEKKGAILGFCGGLLQDILFSSAIGYFALAKIIIGYLVGLSGREIYREQVLAPVFLTLVFTFIHEGLLFLLAKQYIGGGITFNWALHLVFIPKAFMHGLLALPIYSFLYRLEHEHKFSRQGSFKTR